MTRYRLTTTERLARLLLVGAVVAGSVCMAGPALSASDRIAPQTRLRVTVLQWMPIKGAYEQWAALGGEFTVSDAGTLVLPVVGPIDVGTFDSSGLANEIAARLQKKTGLVTRPDTTVEIVEYPPIYIVGDVTAPGEYRYRTGLTVLKAVALGGGELRGSEQRSKDEIQLVGELQGIEIDLLRTKVRLARLEAERSGAQQIDFPPSLTGTAPADKVNQITAQERIIFSSRANEIERQTKSLAELRDLLNAEIGVLEEKIKAAEVSIKTAEADLGNIKTLVEKGIALASRQSDLERSLASYRAERLDQITAIMRARQNISEATRNLEGLRDRQQTEIAAQMQAEQANLEKLNLNREVTQKLLLDLLASSRKTAANDEEAQTTYTITRPQGPAQSVFDASDSTVLLPGDVVKVVSSLPPEALMSSGAAKPEQRPASANTVTQ
ncbi:polysaccharide biosynthesis/export family protein [Oryzicola mucosus]|uniref:Polysaccharide biosynthesis/export family protein n=1 Tax=Oryzicola mucosus TaxID=2767425 RepID=A0A8J6PPU8_9HYPH|nr:polysaccharide biosynthesis/export family protein [Oryzicola mucosus]MBD0415650.1 polysaccharide biosynthesis/export family protein [Oryzicola mucosus]